MLLLTSLIETVDEGGVDLSTDEFERPNQMRQRSFAGIIRGMSLLLGEGLRLRDGGQAT